MSTQVKGRGAEVFSNIKGTYMSTQVKAEVRI